jgi:hypothetical protein
MRYLDEQTEQKSHPRELTDEQLRQAAGAGIDVWEGLQITGAVIGTGVACGTAATGAGAALCVGGSAGTSGLVGDSLSD